MATNHRVGVRSLYEAPMKINMDVESWGWKYLRIEKWVLSRGQTINTLYGIKILRFKIFIGIV